MSKVFRVIIKKGLPVYTYFLKLLKFNDYSPKQATKTERPESTSAPKTESKDQSTNFVPLLFTNI